MKSKLRWEDRYEKYKELKLAKENEAYHRKQMEYFREVIKLIMKEEGKK